MTKKIGVYIFYKLLFGKGKRGKEKNIQIRFKTIFKAT
jgi:hypothetical protein